MYIHQSLLPQRRRLRARYPGDLLAIDATSIEALPGRRRIHFTARDVVSRKDVLAAHLRLTSQAAERVLREAFGRLGFPVRAN